MSLKGNYREKTLYNRSPVLSKEKTQREMHVGVAGQLKERIYTNKISVKKKKQQRIFKKFWDLKK